MTLKEFFDRPEKWTQGVFARGRNNESVSCYGSAGTCFCLEGGIRRLVMKSSKTFPRLLDVTEAYERQIPVWMELRGRQGPAGQVLRTLINFNDKILQSYEDLMDFLTFAEDQLGPDTPQFDIPLS